MTFLCTTSQRPIPREPASPTCHETTALLLDTRTATIYRYTVRVPAAGAGTEIWQEETSLAVHGPGMEYDAPYFLCSGQEATDLWRQLVAVTHGPIHDSVAAMAVAWAADALVVASDGGVALGVQVTALAHELDRYYAHKAVIRAANPYRKAD